MADPVGLKSAHSETTGTLVASSAGRHYLKAYHCISGGTAGDIIFRDGGASGTILFRFNIGTGTQPINLLLPDAGILFETDIHVTLPTASKVTIFYGK
jgi:hypothetical protein